MSPSLSRRELLALSTAAVTGCIGREPTPTSGPNGEGPPPTDGGGDDDTSEGYDPSLDHDETAWAGYDPEWSAPTDNPESSLSTEVVAEGLEIPWDLSFAPNGDLFLTERVGRVSRYRGGSVTTLFTPEDAIDAGSVPAGSDEESWFVDGGEGGTMGVEPHPNYPDVPLVYVLYTANTDDGTRNRLAAFDTTSDEPGVPSDVLFEAPAARIHDGGRLRFGPANYLWASVGETGEGELAADPESLAGKVLRVAPDGSGAPDNASDGDPRVYSLGHRNVQGIAWLPDATAVVDEHGPGPDEVNVVTAGGNQGWPGARTPEEYGGTEYRRPVASSRVERTTWAPSGSSFYRGDAVPALTNRLLVGALGGQRLKAFTLTPAGEEPPPLGETGARHDADWLDDDYTATSHSLLVDELGRIRHVEEGPDGALYAITSNRDGRADGEFPTERDDVLVRITA